MIARVDRARCAPPTSSRRRVRRTTRRQSDPWERAASGGRSQRAERAAVNGQTHGRERRSPSRPMAARILRVGRSVPPRPDDRSSRASSRPVAGARGVAHSLRICDNDLLRVCPASVSDVDFESRSRPWTGAFLSASSTTQCRAVGRKEQQGGEASVDKDPSWAYDGQTLARRQWCITFEHPVLAGTNPFHPSAASVPALVGG